MGGCSKPLKHPYSQNIYKTTANEDELQTVDSAYLL